MIQERSFFPPRFNNSTHSPVTRQLFRLAPYAEVAASRKRHTQEDIRLLKGFRRLSTFLYIYNTYTRIHRVRRPCTLTIQCTLRKIIILLISLAVPSDVRAVRAFPRASRVKPTPGPTATSENYTTPTHTRVFQPHPLQRPSVLL